MTFRKSKYSNSNARKLEVYPRIVSLQFWDTCIGVSFFDCQLDFIVFFYQISHKVVFINYGMSYQLELNPNASSPER